MKRHRLQRQHYNKSSKPANDSWFSWKKTTLTFVCGMMLCVESVSVADVCSVSLCVIVISDDWLWVECICLTETWVRCLRRSLLQSQPTCVDSHTRDLHTQQQEQQQQQQQQQQRDRWESERELSLRRHRTRTTKYNRLVHKFCNRWARLCVGTQVYQIQWNNAM